MIEKIQLLNGITCILARNSCQLSVTINVMFKVGSRDEPPNYHGLTHFIEHMFFRGTPKRPKSQQIALEIEQYGGKFNASTDYDVTFYYITINMKYLTIALDVLSDILFHSSFNQKAIKLEKPVVINENKTRESNPSRYIYEKINKLIFKNITLEHSIGGTDQSIKRSTRNMLLNYVAHFYQPQNTIISLAGNLPPTAKLKTLLNKYFNNSFYYHSLIKKPTKFPSRILYPNFINQQTKFRYDHQLFPKISNAYISMAFPSWSYYTSPYFTCLVIHSLLGANMSSRLFTKIRDDHSLAYTIKTDINGSQDIGVFDINYGTTSSKHNIVKSLKLVCLELKKLKTNKISAKELKKAKEYLIGSDIINREHSDYVAEINAFDQLYLNRIISPQELYKNINKVKISDVQKISKLLFQKKKMNLAIISSMPIKPSDLSLSL